MTSKDPPKRDPAIDFVRGVAILIILIDHIEIVTGQKWISDYTLHALGPTDALAVFVFVSGYVCGRVYGNVLRSKGIGACLKKALLRITQLYMWQVALYAFAAFAIAWPISQKEEFLQFMKLGEAIAEPIRATVLALQLQYHPIFFDILPLYMVLLLLLPAMLFLIQKDPIIAVLASTLVYSNTQLWPTFNIPLEVANLRGEFQWLLNPFSWQILFFVALLPSNGVSFAWLVDTAYSKFVSLGIFVILTMILQSELLLDSHQLRSLADKSTLGIIRLVYSLSLAYLLASWWNALVRVATSPLLRPIAICGRYSLSVFCIGIMMTLSCAALFTCQYLNSTGVKLFELFAVAASMISAYFFSLRVPKTHRMNAVGQLSSTTRQ